MSIHEQYMRRAIELAKRGEGHTNPNPMVGAVIVKDGKIIGEGFHERYGELHAERNAFKNLTESAEGADMYVTLEPCCHHGKQPPCTDAVIAHKIRRVFVGSPDPNPLVSGRGVEILREAGIEVVTDLLRGECDAVNEVFFHYITTGMPYVVAKYAMSADGKIATVTGDSKWITNEESRRRVHAMRGRYFAIMAGIGTVLADDPMLNCRIGGARDPVRVIADSHLSIPSECNILKTADDIKTYIAYTNANAADIERVEKSGAICAKIPAGADGEADLRELMRYLGGQKIDSVLLEGGAELNFSAFKAGIVNKAVTFTAPMIIGGAGAKAPVGGAGFERISDSVRLELERVEVIGGDIMAEYKVGQISSEPKSR